MNLCMQVSVFLWVAGAIGPIKFCSFLFQNSTRQSRVQELWQTKAIKMSCCFSFQSSTSKARALARSTTLALKRPARRCVGIASSGALLLSRFCTRLTTGKRTPARRKGKPWWRSVTGKKTKTQQPPSTANESYKDSISFTVSLLAESGAFVKKQHPLCEASGTFCQRKEPAILKI